VIETEGAGVFKEMNWTWENCEENIRPRCHLGFNKIKVYPVLALGSLGNYASFFLSREKGISYKYMPFGFGQVT